MKKRFSITAALFVAVTLLASPSLAAENKLGDLTIEHAWARATTKSAKSGAAYLTISNAGSTSDKLIDVKSDRARKTQTHLSSIKDGMMKMQHVNALDIPAGGMAELKPGGYHIMFMGLSAPFVENTSFPLTLVFEKAGEITISLPVRKGMRKRMKMKKPNITN